MHDIKVIHIIDGFWQETSLEFLKDFAIYSSKIEVKIRIEHARTNKAVLIIRTRNFA
jgi:hypothetical protein